MRTTKSVVSVGVLMVTGVAVQAGVVAQFRASVNDSWTTAGWHRDRREACHRDRTFLCLMNRRRAGDLGASPLSPLYRDGRGGGGHLE
jgi:hypothetical protein